MAKDRLKSPRLFINRELSWLEFNDRVLREGLCEDLPLLERLKLSTRISATANLNADLCQRAIGLRLPAPVFVEDCLDEVPADFCLHDSLPS